MPREPSAMVVAPAYDWNRSDVTSAPSVTAPSTVLSEPTHSIGAVTRRLPVTVTGPASHTSAASIDPLPTCAGMPARIVGAPLRNALPVGGTESPPATLSVPPACRFVTALPPRAVVWPRRVMSPGM